MRNWKWLLILALLAGLLLTLAACGGDEAQPTAEESGSVSQIEATEEPAGAPTQAPDEEPTDVPTEQPTDVPTEEPTEEPTQAPTEAPEPEPTEQELDFPDLGAMDDLSSYRSLMTMTVTGIQGEEEVEQSIEMLLEQTTDPPAMHMAISGLQTGPEEGFDALQMYVVEDTAYIELAGTWMSLPAEEAEDMTADIFTPDTIMEDTCGWERQADTEVLGVPVQHWTVDQESLERCATEEMLEEMGDITRFDAELYLAIDGGYLVQMDILYEGEGLGIDLGVESEEKIEEASLELHWQFTDVNEPFTIEVPEDARASGALPDDIPLPEEAGTVSSAFGILTFSTTLSGQEVYDFYVAEMPSNGWTEESAEPFGDMYMMEYSKDGRSASFIVTTDADTGETSVLITVLEE